MFELILVIVIVFYFTLMLLILYGPVHVSARIDIRVKIICFSISHFLERQKNSCFAPCTFKQKLIATMNAFDRPSSRRVRSRWPASCRPTLPEVIGFPRQESSRLIENDDSFQKMFLSTRNSYLRREFQLDLGAPPKELSAGKSTF